MTGQCNACSRWFTSLTAFDAHQSWDYTAPRAEQLTCYDPATLVDREGQPRFKLDTRGRWRSAADMPKIWGGSPGD